ncbi:MAG TPA: sigma-54 dependent transcriptional regulator [Terriglobia bacterium]|jgi:two-component system response regulator PilR (NtrC family)|nr:sigma-54 dependent transcriptional regulator [Terriglobia bacterium]
MARLLVIDDEESLCQLLEIAFRRLGHQVETVSNVVEARRKIDGRIYDVIICDIRMPEATGVELLEYARSARNTAAFVLMTAVPTVSSAVDALNLGADRYVVKTDRLIDELKLVIERAVDERALREENVRLRSELLRAFSRDNIVGHSPKIEAVLEVVRNVAPAPSTVLILGESGVGKELVARAIHEASPRREKPFVSVNCGAFPETLLESELFGYHKGAFTGADASKKGIIEAAHGGTLLLDEIGETSLSMQVKLLRVLQERRVRPLGGTSDQAVDVRLIATTNRDLKKMVEEGEFREDFYYRVSVVTVEVPPLRERREDIEPLARHFLERFAASIGKPLHDFDPEALAKLAACSWPGNVRQLEHAVEHAVAVSAPDERMIRASHLPLEVSAASLPFDAPLGIGTEGIDFEREIAAMEKRYLAEALRVAGGVRTRAAELLHMSYRSFRHYAGKYGL